MLAVLYLLFCIKRSSPSQLSLNDMNRKPGLFHQYLPCGKPWQARACSPVDGHSCENPLVMFTSPRLSLARRDMLRRCLHATCSWTRSLPPHCLSEDRVWAELSTGPGLFFSHKYYAIYLVESSPVDCPSSHRTPQALCHYLLMAWDEVPIP